MTQHSDLCRCHYHALVEFLRTFPMEPTLLNAFEVPAQINYGEHFSER